MQERYNYLISTMPLKRLLALINMRQEAKKLRANTVININLGINIDNLCSKHWVYYPEKEYIFFRIGAPHTLESMAPAGHSSLSVEIATFSEPTTSETNIMLTKALEQVCKIFNIHKHNIMFADIQIINPAYVIYDVWRERHLDSLLAHLKSQSIFSVGRFGAWKYTSMYDALQEGISTADQLISTFKRESL
jgi:protoporphyrinogen oxidase